MTVGLSDRYSKIVNPAKVMIPPRLAYYLQTLITQKLLESPAFIKAVGKIDGTLASFRQGISEGWQEAGEEILRRKNYSKSTRNHSSSSSSSSPFSSKATSYSSHESQNSQSNNHTQSKNHQDFLKAQEKFNEILEKLRNQQKQ
ncbi:hypothetical protein O181_005703 [Austropuccinia psidii MF-1]|uniref:Uncharacterized protein n=1 Tax=Austropuccinia psidii MF-1 TaxID=1389203 RepID=A0A9Q3BJ10_9BASI|nr:hypothetical protein [Austropuccinia psidii MF-1]